MNNIFMGADAVTMLFIHQAYVERQVTPTEEDEQQAIIDVESHDNKAQEDDANDLIKVDEDQPIIAVQSPAPGPDAISKEQIELVQHFRIMQRHVEIIVDLILNVDPEASRLYSKSFNRHIGWLGLSQMLADSIVDVCLQLLEEKRVTVVVNEMQRLLCFEINVNEYTTYYLYPEIRWCPCAVYDSQVLRRELPTCAHLLACAFVHRCLLMPPDEDGNRADYPDIFNCPHRVIPYLNYQG